MNDTRHGGDRLVVVSNRLPVVVKKVGDMWTSMPGSGGLVSALAPVLRNRGGIWIGWSGTSEANPVTIGGLLQEAARHCGYSLKPVFLDQKDKDEFYHGFANEVIWPLFHDLQSHCNFAPRYWQAYNRVSRRFSDVIMQNTRPGDFIWIHDYHLMNVAQELRSRQVTARMGFFLHIPFPPPDIYMKLPWRFPILRALLEYDLLGFQTLRDRRNFLQCVRLIAPDLAITGKGQVVTIRAGSRELRVGTFPIGIDYQDFARGGKAEAVVRKARALHEDLPGRQVLLGVDRLDYTKGICHRFEAFRNALQRFPELHHRTTLVQVVVPSREDIPKYNDLKMEMERLVGEINGQFTQSGWVPIHYIFRSLSRTELLAYYRACEIALITPLKDGMNLVAKEFCAATPENDSVLILSEFAGAAAQLQKGALLVNPYGVEEVAETIARAIAMPSAERRTRMRKLKRFVRDYDIFWWVDSFLRAAIAKDLNDFPAPAEYIPRGETVSL
ncbi:trehalose-6-phosphate synthase [Acidiferrobacter sp.]|uniref:alpha,alpha-trehalose-phosphate synthase (UDP-forming) n=1 Tax=Acidiferrobacter sp. TaxID=1872107 RepID=UPI002638EA40|nr:trehalose-6-phosphate synthase [Acidiferrobacter sp.]